MHLFGEMQKVIELPGFIFLISSTVTFSIFLGFSRLYKKESLYLPEMGYVSGY